MRKEKTASRKRIVIAEKVKDKQTKRNGDSIFSYLRLPEGVETFKPKKEGVYRFNIIPYVAGSCNRDTKAGEIDYEYTFWIHNINDGENNRKVICPKKTAGKRCPVCEMIEKLSKNYTENAEEIKALKEQGVI